MGGRNFAKKIINILCSNRLSFLNQINYFLYAAFALRVSSLDSSLPSIIERSATSVGTFLKLTAFVYMFLVRRTCSESTLDPQ